MEIYVGKSQQIPLALTGVPNGYVTVNVLNDGEVVHDGVATETDGVFYFNFPASLAVADDTLTLRWTYAVGSEVLTGEDYLSVVTPYATVEQIRASHPHLASKTDVELQLMESRVRHIIDTYCGQSFGIQKNQTVITEGDGDFVPVGRRVLRLTAAKKNGLEMTNAIEVHPQTPWLIQMVPYFGGWRKADVSPGMENYLLGGGVYELTGDFGWPTVPSAVRLAALSLIGTYFNKNSNQYKEMGLSAVSFADWRMEFEGDVSGSTGSVEADTLLAPYVAPGVMVF